MNHDLPEASATPKRAVQRHSNLEICGEGVSDGMAKPAWVCWLGGGVEDTNDVDFALILLEADVEVESNAMLLVDVLLQRGVGGRSVFKDPKRQF